MNRFKKILSMFLAAVIMATTVMSLSLVTSAADEYAAPEIEVIETDSSVEVKFNVPLDKLTKLQMQHAFYENSKLLFSAKAGKYTLEIYYNTYSTAYNYNIKGGFQSQIVGYSSLVNIVTGSNSLSFVIGKAHPVAESFLNADELTYEYYLRTGNRGSYKYIYGDDKTHTCKVGIKNIADMKVSNISDFLYTGKEREPSINVYDGTKKLKKGTDYTLKYSNNKKIGVATITITGKGDYEGTKKVNFNIVPMKTALKVTKKEDSKVRFAWNPVEGVDGYQIYYSTNGGKYRKITEATPDLRNKIIRKKSFDFENDTYTFKIRSYKVVDGVTYYSPWSKEITLEA